jgi:NB-ARC domain
MPDTIKIFLASSSELEEDRRDFEIFVGRKNKDWIAKGVFLHLVIWEDFFDAVSKTRLQDEYNKAIRECDVFVMLFFTRVGQYTEEEFEAAFGQFKATNKPFIFTYFRDGGLPAEPAAGDPASVSAFKDKLGQLGHFYTRYGNSDRLTHHFSDQLDKLAAAGFIEFTPAGIPAESSKKPAVPLQAPAPAADHVLRRTELESLKGHLLADDGPGGDGKQKYRLLPNTVGLHGIGGAGKTTLARLLCADGEVRHACRDGILWVPIGKHPPEPRAQIADLVTALEGDCDGCSTLPGARARLQAALAGKTILLVLDDVWDEAQIRDIVEVSTNCARLITTRNTLTLPFEAILVDVGTMNAEDARQLLAAGLPAGAEPGIASLARHLGHWPVLLRLANRALRQRVIAQKTPLPKALDAVERDLTRKGVLAFDPAQSAVERDQAVAATVEASLELLDADERRRYTELAIFPQDVPIPLGRAAELWQLTSGLASDAAEELVTDRLDPLSLLDYNGESDTLHLHEMLRSYAAATLAGKAALHLRLVTRWGDRPSKLDGYAWRWLAFHRAEAAMASEQPARHDLTERLVTLVSDESWQRAQEEAIADLPAVREALVSALNAAVADDVPLGVALIVRAADALVQFNREHSRPEPVFDLARQGNLAAARRRTAVFSIDEHWRQALLLATAWLAPPDKRAEAQQLVEEVRAQLGTDQRLHDLLRWIRADLWGEPPPEFAFQVPDSKVDDALIEQLLKRVGGGEYNRELIVSRGLDPDIQDPDRPPPTRDLHQQGANGGETTTGYLADLDGPYLVIHAAKDRTKGTAALDQYLSVYTNYSYSEYRFSTLWLLLGYVVRLPAPDGGPWVRESLERILSAALAGGSVEFEEGLAIAVSALRARAGDGDSRKLLLDQAQGLMDEARRLKPGRRREGSDIWASHKRRMLASAQALCWLLEEDSLASQVLHDALGLADSGFAGYQAPACLTLADAIQVCAGRDPAALPDVEQALEWAQRAAHNIQDPGFCARITARVAAMRRNWKAGFNIEERARWLADGTNPGLASLHRVGRTYEGRRPDALKFPPWVNDDKGFAGLARLYQRHENGFVRLNGAPRTLHDGEDVAVPDPGLAPHLAARISAEILAQAGRAALPANRLQLLRELVRSAVASPTALDTVLTRLVLAQGRRDSGPEPGEISALEDVLARRPRTKPADPGTELLASMA